ncbi:MAG TPA: hypothetical protein VKF17_19660 [Isosphaeraceae bacterium]|nr:hypothetical protein [Isosphaeraceae bacterium]
MTSLVAMYQKGAITADHLVAESLHLLDPENPAPVLDALPAEILIRVLDFTRRYRPDGTVTNYGFLPTPDQVDAARRWIETNICLKPAMTPQSPVNGIVVQAWCPNSIAH